MQLTSPDQKSEGFLSERKFAEFYKENREERVNIVFSGV